MRIRVASSVLVVLVTLAAWTAAVADEKPARKAPAAQRAKNLSELYVDDLRGLPPLPGGGPIPEPPTGPPSGPPAPPEPPAPPPPPSEPPSEPPSDPPGEPPPEPDPIPGGDGGIPGGGDPPPYGGCPS